MTFVAVLFGIAVIFLAAEIILPGGVLGVLAGVAMIWGCILAYLEAGPTGGAVAFAVALVLIIAVLYFEFRILPKTRWGKRAFLRTAVTGVVSAMPDDVRNLVGLEATAITRLSPTGLVDISGRRLEAFSQDGQVPAGTLLRIVRADNFRIIVSTVNPSKS